VFRASADTGHSASKAAVNIGTAADRIVNLLDPRGSSSIHWDRIEFERRGYE
jgi:hypothetical protein